MGRKFVDRNGKPWDVEREHGRRQLVFRPIEGSSADERNSPAPGHTDDPFELSDEELQRLLDRSRPRYHKPKGPPPF